MQPAQSIRVFQTDQDGYFVTTQDVPLLHPAVEVPDAPPQWAIPTWAVLIPPPDMIPGHRRKYESSFGPYQVERRTQGTWVQESTASPQPVEELPGPTEESN